ncbi:MAG: TMEM165/GDT1 family protein [Chloroflexota bacterium]
MLAFWQSLGLIFAAELGDKSQLVALAFATRYRARLVISGVFAATLLVHLGSVALGHSLNVLLPDPWLGVGAGVAFITFGMWTLRGDRLDQDPTRRRGHWGPFLTVAGTFFIAELGDKTMLATVTLAARDASFVGIWLGSTVGMVAADAVAIWAGVALGRRLPVLAIRYGAGAVFILTGALTILSVLS